MFFFTVLVGLIDATMDDWGLQIPSTVKLSGTEGCIEHQQMTMDVGGSQDSKRSGHREHIRNANSLIAIEVLEKLTKSRKALVLLRLVQMNMPEKFNGLLQRLQVFESSKLSIMNLISAKEIMARLSANVQKVLAFECDLKKSFIGVFLDVRSNKHLPSSNLGPALSARWVPFDIYMESAINGRQLPVNSAIEILTEAIITLQVLNQASWPETFLALWLSALRLVQRERDPPEGPVPHLEARLSILLCIVPLAVANVLEDATNLSFHDASAASDISQLGLEHGINGTIHASRRNGLVSSLQVLGQFSGLLYPPGLFEDAANGAAAKAATVTSKSMNVKDSKGGEDHGDIIMKSGGNMRHLIVEACIARKLIDTSAYIWPGYVPTSAFSFSDTSVKQVSPWLTFMEGGVLTASLINSLIATPATSFAEIEKLYYVALSGSNEEKSAAARILCGASLSRGWNIQEHVVKFVVKLLSPPVPSGHTGQQSHLVDYMSMLSAILFGASSIDTVHILSLHGLVPEVAAALMPLCEVFGSLTPFSSGERGASDEPSTYMVFSYAFLFLLRLWKFYKPPLEGGAAGAELTLEYLISLRNSRISSVSHELNSSMNQTFFSDKIYIDYYPRLCSWYCQNKICIASTLSGLCTGNPVYQVANKILSMIYWKITKGSTTFGSSPTPSNSSFGGSPTPAAEETFEKLLLCAWEVLEAIPFVLEAILSACSYGRLSSRDLTTGLRVLVDFLPASLATIISYFTAEVTRGLWKPVPMNGTDWPSPAQIIRSVESEIKEILAATGVNFPNCPSGVMPMLPLPMAALVSLTITFNLDKRLEYIHAVVGPAMENCASGCSWPSMPIIGSLWAQKVRRWRDFIVVSCSLSVFKQSKEAVSQLIRSCFTLYLGALDNSSNSLTNQARLNGLLGNKISGLGSPPIAPGILFLLSCRSIQDIQNVNDIVVGLVTEYGSKSVANCAMTGSGYLESGKASLFHAAARIKEGAMLGASLLCSAGGIQLVQGLYRETIPTWLLRTREEKHNEVNAVSRIIEGYAVAYLVFYSGAFACGAGIRAAPWTCSRRPRIVGVHMDFLARVLEGNVSLGCDPATWRAYISCLVGLVVSFAPGWVQEMKRETLGKLVRRLKGWHECELALSLLERGRFDAMGPLEEIWSLIN